MESFSMDPDESEVREILEKNNFPSLDLAYEEARRMLDIQFAHIDSLDVKSSILVATASIIITLALTTIPSLILKVDLILILAIGGVILSAAITTGVGVYSLWLRDFYNVPSISRMIEKYLRWEEPTAKYKILFQLQTAYNHNAIAIERKTLSIQAAFVFTVVSFAFSSITIIYLLFQFAYRTP